MYLCFVFFCVCFCNNFVMTTQVCAKISIYNTKVNVHLTPFYKVTTPPGFCQCFNIFSAENVPKEHFLPVY